MDGGVGRTGSRKGPAFTREELRALFSFDASEQCETARIMAHSVSASTADWQARDMQHLLLSLRTYHCLGAAVG